MPRIVRQFVRFSFVGTSAFAIDYLVMVALTSMLGMNPVLSSGISFTLSLVYNYALSMKYVFRHREDMSRQKEFAIFAVLATIGLLINEVVMWAGVDVLLFSYLYVKLASGLIVTCWNFASRKRWLDAPEGDLGSADSVGGGASAGLGL